MLPKRIKFLFRGCSPPVAAPESAPELDRLLLPAEVASILGLGVGTLENWRTKGRGPDFLKVAGRIVRYRPSGVCRYIEGRLDRPACA